MAESNFIGGAWKPARSGATDPVLDPATGEQLDEVASSDAADVDDAVGRRGRGVRSLVADHAPRSGSRCSARSPTRIEDDHRRPSRTSRSATSASRVSIIDFEMDLTVDNWRFFAAAAPASSRAAPPASTWRTTRRSCAATRSASSRRSRRGTTRSTWRRGSSAPRSPRATPSCSSRRSSRRSPRCASPRSPPTSSRPGVLNVVTGQGEHAGASLVDAPRRGDGVAHRRRRDRQG